MESGGSRTTAAEITQYLEELRPALDVDLNQQQLALSDAILVLRFLAGFRGASLTDGAVDTTGSRTSATEINDYLTSLLPPAPGPVPLVTRLPQSGPVPGSVAVVSDSSRDAWRAGRMVSPLANSATPTPAASESSSDAESIPWRSASSVADSGSRRSLVSDLDNLFASPFEYSWLEI